MQTTIINDGILELAKNVAGEKNNLHSHAAYREFRERFRYPGEVLEQMENKGYGTLDDYISAMGAVIKIREYNMEDLPGMYNTTQISDFLVRARKIAIDNNSLFLAYAYYNSVNEEKQRENLLLIVKAILYGKLDEIKYDNFSMEVGYTVPQKMKEIWKKSTSIYRKHLSVAEYTDFWHCMNIGILPGIVFIFFRRMMLFIKQNSSNPVSRKETIIQCP